MTDKVKLVYKGLSEAEWNAGKARCELDPDEWEYPRPAKNIFFYYDRKKEQTMGRKTKAARRRRFREETSKEIMQGLRDADAVRQIVGIVFEKDVPTEVYLTTLRSGKGKGFEGRDLIFEREKLLLCTKNGVLHGVLPEPEPELTPEPEPTPEPVAEEKPAPKKRGRPPGPGKKKS